MQEIIDSLLFLSENETNISKENFLLKDEIKTIVNKYFENEKKDIKIDISKNIKINFNKKLFDILIKNLLENAIKYRGRSKKIEISYEN
jgi:signal transduction histidine kinase